MKSAINIPGYRLWIALGLTIILALGSATINLNDTRSKPGVSVLTQALPDEIAESKMGAGPGACGIAVGIAAGVIGLGMAGVTLGFGSALAISAGFHLAGIMCAVTKA